MLLYIKIKWLKYPHSITLNLNPFVVMINYDSLYESWSTKGSYLNIMLDCGEKYNESVSDALKYLPKSILWKIRNKIVFFSTGKYDAFRIDRATAKEKEIIFLSERILPKRFDRNSHKEAASEGHSEVRYFIFVVLHEVAHAVNKDLSPLLITKQENNVQEEKAHKKALRWFNAHIEKKNNKYLNPLTMEEVREEQKKQEKLMEKFYEEGC